MHSDHKTGISLSLQHNDFSNEILTKSHKHVNLCQKQNALLRIFLPGRFAAV
jgi:hypothetical protein